MNSRFVVGIAVVFAAVLMAQPALAQVRLVGSSGESDGRNPKDWTIAVESPDDENLYVIHHTDGSTRHVRRLRGNVDAQLATDGGTSPVRGGEYRDSQHIAYDPADGLLYHRNDTTGYREVSVDPRPHITHLSKLNSFGHDIIFITAPAKPASGDISGEPRDFTFDLINDWFILTE